MIIATFSFSFLSVCVKYLKHIPAHELILFRSIISLVLSGIYLRKKQIPLLGNNKKLLILRGVCGTIALTLFFLAIHKIPLASAATIQYLSPIFTAIIGIYFLKEKVKNIQWLFFAIALSGVICIKGFDQNVNGFYVLIAVISAIFAGMAYNLVRSLKKTDHPVVIVFYFPLVATPIMVVWCLFDWVNPIGVDWLILILIGVLTQIGQVFMSKSLHLEKAAKTTSIKFLGTINALIFSIFFFKETYTWISIVGILLVSIGVIGNIYFSERKLSTNAS